MRNLALILFLAVFSLQEAAAQNIGLVAGGGTSDIIYKTDNSDFNTRENENRVPIFSYLGGLSFESSLVPKKLYLQFGLYSMQKGYDYKDEDGYEEWIHAHFFHLPLELKYKFFFDDMEEYSFNIAAGGYFGGGFAGKHSDTGFHDDSQIEFGKTSGEDMYQMDWGLNFRAEIGLSKVRLGYNYGLGLADANLLDEDEIAASGFESMKEAHQYHQIYLAFYFTNE